MILTQFLLTGLLAVIFVALWWTLDGRYVPPAASTPPPLPTKRCRHTSVPWPVLDVTGTLVSWLCDECGEQRDPFTCPVKGSAHNPHRVSKRVVICRHEETTTIRVASGEIAAVFCADCGLDPDSEPIIFHEGEGEKWWPHLSDVYKREREDRVGLNKITAARTALVEERNEWQEIQELERMVHGETEFVGQIQEVIDDLKGRLERLWP